MPCYIQTIAKDGKRQYSSLRDGLRGEPVHREMPWRASR
jgi:hypothetical protein